MKPVNQTKILLILLIAISLFSCVSCEKFANGPSIEWITGSSIIYNYRSGVIAGFTAHIKFRVSDNTSGEIKMTAEYEGQGKSCTGFVEPGKDYKAVVVCGISSTQQNGKVIVDCPTVSEPYTISTDVKTGVSSISIQEL
ncbi:MAG: hypothetical protein H6545_05635 [Bacteroidales bacterium]|jgi:hypothetical protein|nr:hypothetical protein [Bacteroidales bacterium]NLD62310.1 hypothetical protein [Bacteroidales bacterium]HOO67047.1 hypothetical protein [Bacteroidales bacterium]HPQ64777.1 hypothetical protein [Bacteroidales bacterium]HRW27065.1 hypothetical protein [Bacteroidales bacterium]